MGPPGNWAGAYTYKCCIRIFVSVTTEARGEGRYNHVTGAAAILPLFLVGDSFVYWASWTKFEPVLASTLSPAGCDQFQVCGCEVDDYLFANRAVLSV